MLFTRARFLFTMCLIGLVAAGCSRPDDDPPVGTVSVTAAHPRLPVGSPLELTYRFELSEPLDEDHTVFVHMVDADGEARWNDDHQPPVPTSAWKPGVPVEYTRTRFLPVALIQPGDVTLEVGLYRDAERLPLQGPRPSRQPGSRAYPVADLQLTPESERIFLIFQDGWYPDEFSADDPAAIWKWTDQSATLRFRHPKQDATLLLEYAARPDLFGAAPQLVTILGADGDPIETFPADASDRVLRRIPLSSQQMGDGDLAELRLEVDRTFVPAEHPDGGQDTRRLGIRVYQVFVQSR